MHPVLASPVGGELKGGLIINEYEEITAGLRLQNEVTMVPKLNERVELQQANEVSPLLFQNSAGPHKIALPS